MAAPFDADLEAAIRASLAETGGASTQQKQWCGRRKIDGADCSLSLSCKKEDGKKRERRRKENERAVVVFLFLFFFSVVCLVIQRLQSFTPVLRIRSVRPPFLASVAPFESRRF